MTVGGMVLNLKNLSVRIMRESCRAAVRVCNAFEHFQNCSVWRADDCEAGEICRDLFCSIGKARPCVRDIRPGAVAVFPYLRDRCWIEA